MLKLKHFLSSFEGRALVTFWDLITGLSAIYSVPLNYQRSIVEIRSPKHIYILKSHDQNTRCICSAQSAQCDRQHSRWEQAEIWPRSNLQGRGPSHSAHTLSQSQQENQQLIQNAYSSLNVCAWVRLFIVGTALIEPNEWIKWIHSTAENLDAKPGWCPCS